MLSVYNFTDWYVNLSSQPFFNGCGTATSNRPSTCRRFQMARPPHLNSCLVAHPVSTAYQPDHTFLEVEVVKTTFYMGVDAFVK